MTSRPHISPQTGADPANAETLHASCVAVNGCGVLILGASGQGKSSLALQLMSLGAELVSDDRTRVWRDGDKIIAHAPARLSGLIEAREVGILRVDPVGPAPVSLMIDMDRPETNRLPERMERPLLGCPLPCLGKSDLSHFPAAILTYLRGQREA